MFDLYVVNAFSKSTVNIIKKFSASRVRKGEIKIYKNIINNVGGVVVFVCITGDLEGRLIFSMTKETALKLASALNMERMKNINDLFIATLKEFVNMVAGGAISEVADKKIDLDMTPPTILMSREVAVFEKMDDKILSINYKTDIGDIFMNLHISELKNKND